MTEVTQGRDRITELRIEGMRALADVRLPLGGLTVLIGDNGSGKSSIIEALEMLRKVAWPSGTFIGNLVSQHGDLGSILRIGAPRLRVGVRIEGEHPGPLDYTFALAPQANGTMIVAEESLDVDTGSSNGTLRAIARDGSGCQVFDRGVHKPLSIGLPHGQLALITALAEFGATAQPAIRRVIDVLSQGRVHVGFEVEPLWVAGEEGRQSPLRQRAMIGAAAELERRGRNLANCYHALKEEHPRADWERVLERVRAGLGLDITEIKTPSAGKGFIELSIHFRGLMSSLPASALSAGQLSYLAFVALTELGKQNAFHAFDEPELHLHPQLLVRVTWLLEELAKSAPVLVSTHSDRLLDALYEPAKSVVLCELDEHRATRLYRPDENALAEWLTRYRGVGELRAEGYDGSVFTEPVTGRA